MILEDKTFSIAQDIRYRRVLDEAVVVRQETNEVIIINEVSASILDFFEERAGVTVADLVDYLTEEYEVNRQNLEKDIPVHIEELQSAGIIIAD